MPQNVLIVAAHPDDEILGVGGTIAAHAARGDEVHVMIMAQGAASRMNEAANPAIAEEVEALKACARKAAETLGARTPVFADFPDNRMDSVDLLDVVKAVEERVAQCNPSTVYTHAGSDLNIDHQITHQAVLTACRPLPGVGVENVLCFETVSSTEWAAPSDAPFVPNMFIDIADTLAAKLEALRCYETEMRPFPHARSLAAVEALAKWRGASVGLDAAEAFQVARIVKR